MSLSVPTTGRKRADRNTPEQPDPLPELDLRVTRAEHTGPGMAAEDRPWPGRVRRIVRAHLRSWRCASAATDAALVATELVTNAFLYGSGAEIGVRMTLAPPHLRIEIDSGPGSWRRPSARPAGRLEEGGRGLLLVAGLCDAWGVSADGSRTWCTLTVAADEPEQVR